MRRLVLRIIFALVVGVALLVGVAIAIYAPRGWRSAKLPVAKDPAEAGRLRRDVESFPPYRSRTHREALNAMEALVTARLESLGWHVTAQEVRADANPHRSEVPNGPPTHNLLATKNRSATDPLVLFGSHLDAVPQSPGADDNGSGVAVMLELARVLSPEAASHVELCFFNEEEEGLIGSFTFVTSLAPDQRAQMRAAYVMDMVGAYVSTPHSQTYPKPLSWFAPDRGDFLSTIALSDADAELKALHRAHDRIAPGLALEVFEPPRPLADKLRDLWRSDHAPFWEAGIPAVFFTDTGNFRSPRYHTPNDVAEVLDYERMALLTELLAEMATANER